MKRALLTLAVLLVLTLPALAQPGPGIGGTPQPTPAATAPAREPGPGFGFVEEKAAPAAAPASSPAAPAAKPAAAAAPAEPGAAKPATNAPAKDPIYDESADAKKVVADAVARAKKEKKRVLVTLGANWCGWCRALEKTFTKDEKVAAEIAKAYVPVKVDVGRMTKNLELAASWGADPKQGVPLLVVLDGSGKAVKVQETGSLEAGKGHDPEKVLAFLKANAGI